MRKIEQQMLSALNSRKNWANGNTTVQRSDGYSNVILHGHIIATVYDLHGVSVNEPVLKRYPTTTTKSRLRALGVDVCTRKGVTYLNDEAI